MCCDVTPRPQHIRREVPFTERDERLQHEGSIPRGTLDEKTVKQCGGPSCKFVHVSAGYPNTRHVHKDVFVGILSALTRMDKKVKTAWTEAMSGPQGEKVFKKPFANEA